MATRPAVAFLLREAESDLEAEGSREVRDYARQLRQRIETLARLERRDG